MTISQWNCPTGLPESVSPSHGHFYLALINSLLIPLKKELCFALTLSRILSQEVTQGVINPPAISHDNLWEILPINEVH